MFNDTKLILNSDLIYPSKILLYIVGLKGNHPTQVRVCPLVMEWGHIIGHWKSPTFTHTTVGGVVFTDK